MLRSCRFFSNYLILFIFIVSFSCAGTAQAQSKELTEPLRLAVASNFAGTAKVLAQKFTEQSGFPVSISTASTGKLYAQIRQGAPFDILLAADRLTPERLCQEGLALEPTLVNYARGRLMFLRHSAKTDQEAEVALRGGNFQKLAIANPDLAPYGLAAMQVLTHLGLTRQVRPRLVIGENIGQAGQFFFSGNADAALLPRTQVLEAQGQQKKMAGGWLIPEAWHAPLVQTGVLLKRGEKNPGALAFIDYLQSSQAKDVMTSHGYD